MSAPASAACPRCGAFAPMVPIVFGYPTPEAAGVPLEACATCGLLLDGDPDDEPDGDAGMPICGACNRARNFDAIEAVVLMDDVAG